MLVQCRDGRPDPHTLPHVPRLVLKSFSPNAETLFHLVRYEAVKLVGTDTPVVVEGIVGVPCQQTAVLVCVRTHPWPDAITFKPRSWNSHRMRAGLRPFSH